MKKIFHTSLILFLSLSSFGLEQSIYEGSYYNMTSSVNLSGHFNYSFTQNSNWITRLYGVHIELDTSLVDLITSPTGWIPESSPQHISWTWTNSIPPMPLSEVPLIFEVQCSTIRSTSNSVLGIAGIGVLPDGLPEGPPWAGGYEKFDYLQPLPMPELSIFCTNETLTLTWPSEVVNFHIETTTNLNSSWSIITNTPYQYLDLWHVEVPITNKAFYRLYK